MYALDFEYDGQFLSDYGFSICDFGSQSDFNTTSAGSEISFKTVSRHGGKEYGLAGTFYDECITSTFNICKDPCNYHDLSITNDEYRDLMRWLNRREFLRFRLVETEEEHVTCYYDASFNVQKIMFNRELYGLELTMTTNRPFGYGERVKETFNMTNSTTHYYMHDLSDEIGHIYPTLKITLGASGNLTLTNHTLNCAMIIKNCTTGEVINIDGSTHIITSSLNTAQNPNAHKIYNDFNFEYFKIGNTFDNRKNDMTASISCQVEISYNPIIKDTPD